MTTPTDRPPEHVPGQLSFTIARGTIGGPLVPVTREELTEQLERLDFAQLEHRASALADVTRHTRDQAAAAAALDRAVAEARGLGATWQQIADAAGMTRQSAWRRWSTGAYPGGPDEVEP
jgi:DNA-binding phage protein